jgi:putative Holliday junction resolvase
MTEQRRGAGRGRERPRARRSAAGRGGERGAHGDAGGGHPAGPGGPGGPGGPEGGSGSEGTGNSAGSGGPGGIRRGRRLAVDVGDARIGVASCDPEGILATPVETVPGRDVPAAQRRLAALVAEYDPIEVVVGLPRSLNGSEGPAAAKVRGFALAVAKIIAPVPVRLVDERMSTVTATHGLRASGVSARKGRSVVDQAAAVVILQSALETERVSGTAPGENVEVVI